MKSGLWGASEGAAAAFDGIFEIVGWTPFESAYKDACGRFKDGTQWSRRLGAFSRDVYLMSLGGRGGRGSLKGTGNHSVYQGVDEAGKVRYVGITERAPGIRWAEHGRAIGTGRENLQYYVLEGAKNLTKTEARIFEQKLINKYGMEKLGCQLLNKINSIAPKLWGKFGISP